MKTKRQPIHHMQIPQSQMTQRIGHIQMRLAKVGTAHIIEHPIRRHPHPNVLWRPDLQHCIQDLTQKAKAVSDTATITIATLIGLRLQELINQIAISRMHLYPITPSLFSQLSRTLVVIDGGLDLSWGERTRGFIRLRPLWGMDMIAI